MCNYRRFLSKFCKRSDIMDISNPLYRSILKCIHINQFNYFKLCAKLNNCIEYNIILHKHNNLCILNDIINTWHLLRCQMFRLNRHNIRLEVVFYFMHRKKYTNYFDLTRHRPNKSNGIINTFEFHCRNNLNCRDISYLIRIFEL